jgi:hypothetical protein
MLSVEKRGGREVTKPQAARLEERASAWHRVCDACERLRAFIEAECFRGYDPYDGLNSPFLKLATLGSKWPRIAAIQLMKRSPVNLRPLLLVRKGYNPKGLGLILWSYAKLYGARGDETARSRALELLELLGRRKSVGVNGNAWGYNFDWQSRAFFVPKGTPTIVNSSFVGHALLDAYALIGDERFLLMALPIREFILRDLNRTKVGDTFCFSYTPLDHTIVHNANLLGASLLIRLDRLEPSAEGREAALASLAYSMSRQREDGSWWYADTDYQKWIDSFHTGFNLQAIRWFLELGEADAHRPAYERGVRFYAERFFDADGTAKYFHDRAGPEDIHSYTQAIVFFSGEGGAYRDLASRVDERLFDRFLDPCGYFYFQRRNGRPIRIPYMRWSQAWAFHALSEYLLRTGPAADRRNQASERC